MPMTAQQLFQKWTAQAEADIKTGRTQRVGRVHATKRLQALQRLIQVDLPHFIAEEQGEACALTQAHLDALGLLLGARPAPIRVQRRKAKKAEPPTASAELLGQGFHRVSATRSVAASKLGETHALTLALGFHQPVEQTGPALFDELGRQKRILQQKDENGRDLAGAGTHRAALKAIGLSDSYIKRKIDPLLEQLAPFSKPVTAITPAFQSLVLWERTTITAGKEFLDAAERVFDDPKRVLQYRNAQPISQAGRFTKVAIAKRQAAKAKKAATKAQQEAEEAAKKAARKAKKDGKVPPET